MVALEPETGLGLMGTEDAADVVDAGAETGVGEDCEAAGALVANGTELGCDATESWLRR